MPATYNILIMGASYGSLLASKLLFGGHTIKLVCLPAEADLINADGQPIVTVSRFKSSTSLPERVATTDLFHVVARKAAAAGLTFYMFGADEDENAAAVANVQKAFPNLRIVGRSHGYLKGDALRAKVDEINALAPP